MKQIVLIFKSVLTSPETANEQVFIEAHDENGNSINIGEWAADGEHESLTIDDKFLHSKHIKQLDDVTAIAVNPGNADVNEYMRGMANGLLLAQSIFADKEPVYIEAPAPEFIAD